MSNVHQNKDGSLQMADDSSEQPTVNSPSATEAIPVTSEPPNLNPKSETKEDMEVHHHAHHGHEKKTWKHYFWEFFMLFLAVVCGFLAELQLEHYIEHKREKEYIKLYKVQESLKFLLAYCVLDLWFPEQLYLQHQTR